jgi:hypothetical protein
MTLQLWQRKLTTIMLGVSGCIYKKTEEQLKQLGIQGKALSRLLTRIHHMAGRHVEEIWNTRHAAIATAGYYISPAYSKRKRESHGQPLPDHRKRKKLK